MSLESLLPLLCCPKSGTGLVLQGDRLVAADTRHSYPFIEGNPDLRAAPARLSTDLPWYEPWDEIDAIELAPPPRLVADDLPYHLYGELAGLIGDRGAGRRVLEVGCGARGCEPYFTKRGFEYVGTDIGKRGIGPQVYSDAHNLPFRAGGFDVYLSLAVYQHLLCPLLAAREAYRVLKPGGLICGTSVFVYGFHDRASFHHMSHGCLLWMLRTVGFETPRIWPDWRYWQSIPEMAYTSLSYGAPWRFVTSLYLRGMDWLFTTTSSMARGLTGKSALDLHARAVKTAASLTWVARKPAAPAVEPAQRADRRSG